MNNKNRSVTYLGNVDTRIASNFNKFGAFVDRIGFALY